MQPLYCALLPAIVLAGPANAYTPPRAADGHPDLQGVWANNTATPLERPAMLQGRAFLTEQWTRPWTLMIPLKHSDQHIYEYACHEGNFGLAGILSGARADERAAGEH